MLIAVGATTCGATHKRNEDRILVGTTVVEGAEAPGTAAQTCIVAPTLPFLCTVFDGVGGSVRGDLAALAAARALSESESKEPLAERLMNCADSVVTMQEDREEHERGLTVGAGAEISASDTDQTHLVLTPFHMGDCRVYVHAGGELTILTHDHSMAQRYRDELGEDVQVPPTMAHVVTSYAGGQLKDPFEVGTPRPFDANDIALMCSDGLWEHISTEAVGEILDTARSALQLPKEQLTDQVLAQMLTNAAGTLTEVAQKNGSPDDISLVLIWNAPVAVI